jgi:uncharacterized protein (UPF0332 family)
MDNVDRQSVSDAWSEAAQDALNAARELKERAHYRSSVSRAYYAVYAYVAAALVLKPGVTFREARDGPAHESLADVAARHLRDDLVRQMVTRVRAGISAMYNARLLADYRPRERVDEALAIEVLKHAATIAKALQRMRP